MRNIPKTGGAFTTSEDISKKQNVSVLECLNYRHEIILSKLDDARMRLRGLTLGLGGEYLGEKSPDQIHDDVENNHLSAYDHLINRAEDAVAFMFQDLERLECLMRK